jgi:hypothetical protein
MPLDNNLLIAFCAIKIDVPEDAQAARENEYYQSLRQVKNILPNSFDLVICDNTLQTLDDLKDNRLKEILKNEEHYLFSENLGKTNKGAGELDMLCQVVDEMDISDYDSVTYLSSRRIVTCPYIFERVENMTKDAIMSNPPIIDVITGYQHPVNHNLYNDMFFAMKPDLMQGYTDFSKQRLQFMIQNRIGSEQNLYHFVNENNIQYEWLNSLGFVRFDRELGTIQYI